MSATTDSLRTKVSWTRGRPSGWADFGRKQHQEECIEAKVSEDPFPPIQSTFCPLHSSSNIVKNRGQSAKSFSSVLLPSAKFPALTKYGNCKKMVELSDHSKTHGHKDGKIDGQNLAFIRLKELHPWADQGLIEDVLEAVGGDIEASLTLFRGMAPDGSFKKDRETEIAEQECTSNHVSGVVKLEAEKDVIVKKTCDLAIHQTDLEGCVGDDVKEPIDRKTSFSDQEITLIPGQLSFIPVEPEWEEDDLYWIHRKGALQMMRSAARHSKAAANAFLRGDHLSAQQHSLESQEQWSAAERLNAKAAEEILSIRNCNNDWWKLDLHGLHAMEAVQALHEHLLKIETLWSLNDFKAKNKISYSSSSELSNSINTRKLAVQLPSMRQRPSTLEVITGVGNHSRGEAALPSAVKNYLTKNGYHFDEVRPGMIAVRLKFRHM